MQPQGWTLLQVSFDNDICNRKQRQVSSAQGPLFPLRRVRLYLLLDSIDSHDIEPIGDRMTYCDHQGTLHDPPKSGSLTNEVLLA